MKGFQIAPPFFVVSRAYTETFSGWSEYHVLGVTNYDVQTLQVCNDARVNSESFYIGNNGKLLMHTHGLEVTLTSQIP